MSSATYSLVISYLDLPKTHPNLPDNTIGWDGVLAIVHDENFVLWTEGEPASPGLAQYVKTSNSSSYSNLDLLSEEIKASPHAAELAIRGDTSRVGSNVAGTGDYCSSEFGSTIEITPERSHVTLFLKMTDTADWFTGTTMNLYHQASDDFDGDFVLGGRQLSYPMDLGISSSTTFFPSWGEMEWLDTPEPVTSYYASADNMTLWGNNGTLFDASCGTEIFPVASFYLNRLFNEKPDYPDLRIACGILGGISFLSIALSVVLWRKQRK